MTWKNLLMRLKNLDLLLIIAISILNVLWIMLPSHSPLMGVVLALPFVFLFPGYALTQALYHNRSLDKAQQFILSLGLSFAINILNGFILNIFPVGLQAKSWAVSLGLLTVFFSLLAVYLRRKPSIDEILWPKLKTSIRGYLLIGLAITIAILSVWYSVITVVQQPYPGFTQFWMLPSKQSNESCAVLVGVHSFESVPVTYRVVMTMNGIQVTRPLTVILEPQQERDWSISLKLTAANTMNIEAQLYRADKPNIRYREVHMTLNSSGASKERKVQCRT